jgi:hypothetical protein
MNNVKDFEGKQAKINTCTIDVYQIFGSYDYAYRVMYRGNTVLFGNGKNVTKIKSKAKEYGFSYYKINVVDAKRYKL